MALKAIIRLGDPTSHGGTVVEAFPTFEVFGKAAAGIGHKVSCPQCKGVFPIVAGVEKVAYLGKNIAVEGMKTACGAVLIATQQEVKTEAPRGVSPLRSTQRAIKGKQLHSFSDEAPGDVLDMFNEKFVIVDHLTGERLANVEYAIRRVSGDMEYGVSNADGETHLLATVANAEMVDLYVEG
ncbi:PAAR domain-containing protein [Chitinibacteraceae bacterium HSL-7]